MSKDEISPREEMARAARADVAAATRVQPQPTPTPQPNPAAPKHAAVDMQKPLDLMTMFDLGTPDHLLVTMLPYRKSLQAEIQNLQNQRQAIEERIIQLRNSEAVLNRTLAGIADPNIRYRDSSGIAGCGEKAIY